MVANESEKEVSVSSKINRLERLKKLRQKAIRSNNQERQDEIKKQRAKSQEWKLSTTQNHDDTEESTSIGTGTSEKKEDWEWTIEECTKWEKKQKDRPRNSAVDDYQNIDKLAELSYKKELDSIGIDKEEYARQKRKIESTHERDKVSKSGIFDTQVDNHAIAKLAEKIRHDGTLKIKRRKNDDDDKGEYINHKNKQFNLKLDRDYRN